MMDLKSVKQFGLLANGSTPLWEVSIDESLNGDDEWLIEIAGRHVEIAFRLSDLDVISRAIDFLNLGLESFHGDPPKPAEGDLVLGMVGDAGVSLVWDNEDSPRLRLVASRSEGSCFGITFLEEDVRMLLDALLQVQSDL